MLKIAITLTFAAIGTAAFGATPQLRENVGFFSEAAAGVSDDEVQAFDVYDEITESIFEGFRLYHPHECRDFFVRKTRLLRPEETLRRTDLCRPAETLRLGAPQALPRAAGRRTELIF